MAEHKERKLHYDLLRIIASFSVVVLHVSAQAWYITDLHSKEWLVTNAYDAVFRFGVPIFVMISGALFLDPGYQLNAKRLYKHNIFRMIILYMVWCAVYGLFKYRGSDLTMVGIKPILRSIVNGYYHLWFIPMIVGLYLLLPILKDWINKAEKRQIEYFLALFFVLQILRTTFRTLVISDELQAILDLGEIQMVCGYLGYFVWGYYLAHVGIGGPIRKCFYILAIPAAVINVVVSTLLSWRAAAPEGVFFDSYGICTFLIVTFLFVFTVDKGSSIRLRKNTAGLIREISANTLGVYLIHVGMLEVWQQYGLHSMTLPVAAGVPIVSILCFVVCTMIAGILRRIPFVGRYIC